MTKTMKVICPNCNGKGHWWFGSNYIFPAPIPCIKCNETGYIEREEIVN